MRFFLLFVPLFLFFIAQISIFPNILPAWLMPNILLVALIIFAFYQLEYKNLITLAFLSGSIVDIYSGIPFGVITLSFILTIFCIDLLVNNFFNKADFLVISLGVIAGSILYMGFYFGFLKTYELLNVSLRLNSGYRIMLETVLLFIFSNAVATVILYLPFKKLISFVNKFQ